MTSLSKLEYVNILLAGICLLIFFRINDANGTFILLSSISISILYLLFLRNRKNIKTSNSINWLFLLLFILMLISNLCGIYSPVLCTFFISANALPIVLLIRIYIRDNEKDQCTQKKMFSIAACYIIFSILPVLICFAIGNPMLLAFSFLGAPISLLFALIVFLLDKVKK